MLSYGFTNSIHNHQYVPLFPVQMLIQKIFIYSHNIHSSTPKSSILSSQKRQKETCMEGLSNAPRDRELKSKLAKQHNRKCEGQEDRASSLSLHRQQSAAALLTPEN